MKLINIPWLSRISRLLLFSQKCPLCTSVYFNQAEYQSSDRILALFGFRPVRCVNCFRRYYRYAVTEVRDSKSQTARQRSQVGYMGGKSLQQLYRQQEDSLNSKRFTSI